MLLMLSVLCLSFSKPLFAHVHLISSCFIDSESKFQGRDIGGSEKV